MKDWGNNEQNMSKLWCNFMQSDICILNPSNRMGRVDRKYIEEIMTKSSSF